MMEFKLGCYKDPNTSLTWPSVSPTGWSMEWEPSPTSDNSTK